MKQIPTATQVANLKREAKQLARSGTSTHAAALEQLARAAGYDSWHEMSSLQGIAQATTSAAPMTLVVDPILPRNFDDTPNGDRSKAELDRWWLKPFVVTRGAAEFEVRCLDGGAWDRSSFYGTAPDLPAARELAAKKLAWWNEMRDSPHVVMPGDDSVMLAIEPTRPDELAPVLAAAASSEQIHQVFEEWKAASPLERSEQVLQARRRAHGALKALDSHSALLRTGCLKLGSEQPASDMLLLEVAVLLLLLSSWRTPSTVVTFTLPEVAHYLRWVVGEMNQDHAAEVLRALATSAFHMAQDEHSFTSALVDRIELDVHRGVDRYRVQLGDGSRHALSRLARKGR